MKYKSFIIAFLVFCISCNDRKSEKQPNVVTEIPLYQNTIEPVSNDKDVIIDSITIRNYADSILRGEIELSDNIMLFEVLGQLYSADSIERGYYFKVYIEISKKADGAVSEVLGGYIKTFLKLYPEVILKVYPNLDIVERELLMDNLSYEFLASGIDYKNDIASFFDEIKIQIEERSVKNIAYLDSIENNVIRTSAKYLE